MDISESVNKYARSTDHLGLNKFRRASDEEFQCLATVFRKIVQKKPEILAPMSKCYLATMKILTTSTALATIVHRGVAPSGPQALSENGSLTP